MASLKKQDKESKDAAENFKDISTNLTVTLIGFQKEPGELTLGLEEPSDSIEARPLIERQQQVIARLREKLHLQKKLYTQKMSKLVRSNMKKRQKLDMLLLNLKLTDRKLKNGNKNECKECLGSKQLTNLQLTNEYSGSAMLHSVATNFKNQCIISDEIALVRGSYMNEDWLRNYAEFRTRNSQEFSSIIQKIEEVSRKKLHTLSLKLKEQFESKVKDLNRRSGESLKELKEAKRKNRELASENKELRKTIDQKERKFESIEEQKRIVTIQLGTSRSKLKSLEGKLTQSEEKLKSVVEKCNKAIALYDRQLLEKQSKLEEQKKVLRTQEDMIIGFCDTEMQDPAHWPKFFKIQAERIARSEKRIVHLETENDLLHEQLKSLMYAIRNLEEELASKDDMLSQLENRVPDTVALFRDKEALLRELRSQLNHRDLQLLDYSRELDRMKRINKHLESSLRQISTSRNEPCSNERHDSDEDASCHEEA